MYRIIVLTLVVSALASNSTVVATPTTFQSLGSPPLTTLPAVDRVPAVSTPSPLSASSHSSLVPAVSTRPDSPVVSPSDPGETAFLEPTSTMKSEVSTPPPF